jgi:dihydrofolate reductase
MPTSRFARMRNLVLSVATMSVDGYICEENTDFWRRFGPFAMPAAPDDAEQDEMAMECIRHAGVHIMGRVTYEAWADFWPTSTWPVAAILNDIPKVVFSTTLTETRWPEARIASGDLAEEAARLKAEDGGEIIAHGGARFMQSLVRTGLVDEYRLAIFAVAVGSGMPLFTNAGVPYGLHLLSCHSFQSGVMLLRYRPLTEQELADRVPAADTGLETQRERDAQGV